MGVWLQLLDAEGNDLVLSRGRARVADGYLLAAFAGLQ